MRSRPFIWILLCLLCLAGAWLLWPRAVNTRTRPSALQKVAAPTVTTIRSASTAPKILTPVYANSAKAGTVLASTNPFAWRLSNAGKTIDQLVNDSHAILLENALIDTGSPLTFSIPTHLQSQGDPGAYIVQARGPIDNAFRAMLASAGAEIVSYIPNNAYLVRAPAGVANGLAANPLTQAVMAYEPYYKIQSSMLTLAVGQMDLPDGTVLTLGLFTATAPQTIKQIENLDWKVLSREETPVGTIVRVQQPLSRSTGWLVLATLPGTKNVELSSQRVPANDLSRVATGVAANTRTTTNYLDLSGSNVLVQVNDFGIDATHPDLAGRVFGSPTTDTSGHGTHVAGIIAGNGLESTMVTNARGSIMPGTNGQFRGKAPRAKLLSMNQNLSSDRELQEAAARTNALISNNSWNYDGDNTYNLAAASYDAAVRDALPLVTGSQPVLFVFSAGNFGNGDDTIDPGGGKADTIQSPATAKNVITVGALQEFRNITNKVITISADGVTNTGTPWQPETSTSFRMAGFSSRGNVGIGIEGTYGRYKPDVVAPGTFVVSTRSAQWDIANYFYINPTNHTQHTFGNIIVQPDAIWAHTFPIIPNNTVQAAIYVTPNPRSPVPFPLLPIYFGLVSSPAYTSFTTNNQVLIPPDGGLTIATILGSQVVDGFNYGVSNSIANPISISVTTDIVTTNNPGDYFLVLSNLNQSIGIFNPANTSPGPYYRYQSGTSMSAADVSGVLALMQDYFTNTLHATPSPVLLKAMLINGARVTGSYDFQAQNSINYEGWGLVNLTNAVPPGITNQLSAACASFFVDQSPTNALATGDSHTYNVTVNNTAAALPLRITLAWTDPPGDPAAAIKLVNDLNLVVTNLSNSTKPFVYYGNDIPASSTFNSAHSSTNTPNYDFINNVENVYLPPGAGTNFSVTVLGYRVNVNAVTAQTNNVVQDYALVISSGNGQVTNAFTVTDNPIVSNPTADQQITFVTSTNKPLLNQLVGASTPLLGTNTIPLGTNLVWGGTNSIITLGMTNQWHFYVVTNTTGFTNAAFITFNPNTPNPDTLSVPRMGVFAGSAGNATRPEADIDLYVTTDPTLMNLNPVAISNCVNGAQVGASSGNSFNGASLGRGDTEFVVDTNSNPSIPGEVYYVGVYSEDQEASEYGFIPIFSERPFSQMNPNGSQSVFGVPLPVDIPDGTPARPGHGYIFGLALYPMQMNRVVVTDTITHQNFGDLIGTMTHGGQNGLSRTTVLNNHVSLGNPPGPYTIIYDDSGQGDIIGSQPSDGPGSLNTFTGQQGNGVWLLTETDDSLTQIGSVTGFNMLIEPHHPLDKGITTILGPLGWFYEYIDVPPEATNLTIYAMNLPPHTGTVDLFVKVGARPTLTDTNEFGPARLTNNGPLGLDGSISIGPPLTPGRYWVGLYNESLMPQTVYVIAKLGMGAVPGQVIFSSSGPAPILDDAVMTNSVFVTAAQTISSVEAALRVDHPRVSDLVFHLISPDGTRVLLVENRGGTTTNGMGATLAFTNITPASSSGTGLPSTNVIDTGQTAGAVQISYNFYTQPDEMVVQYQGANIFDSGIVNGSGMFTIAYGPGASTQLTIIMNPTVYAGDGDLWDYTVNSSQARYTYLVLTEDTNKTTTPIKFAPVPFVPTLTNMSLGVGWTNWPASAGGNGHWYKAVATNGLNVNWTKCDQIAHAAGGYLATITSAAENTFVFSLINNGQFFRGRANNGSGPAIGGIQTNTASGPAAGWSWETGEPWGYTNWFPGQPDDFGGDQNRLVFFSNSQGVPAPTWDDINSTDSNIGGYVIERNPVKSGNDIYYLPEQSLDTFAGLNANGQWQLEIWDNRVGAGLTNMLVSWQLRFNFPTTVSSIGSLTNGTPQTNGIPAGGIAYYLITVPINADIATNILISPNGPLNLWFDQVTPPTGAGAGDYLLLGGSTNGTAILYTNGTPPLVPGSTYYLGVQNTNSFAVTNYTITVDFHLIPVPIVLTNGQPQTNTVPAGGIDYYLVNVPTNADWATNLLLFAGGPLNVWFNPTNLPAATNPPDILLFGGATNGISIFGTNTIPTNIVPGGSYYLAVQNTNSIAVTYGIEVDFHTLTQIVITNSTPITNSIPTNGMTQVMVVVPTNAIWASNILISATGPLNVWFNQTNPPTGSTNTGDFLMFSATNAGVFVLTGSSVPPLVPGMNYFLGFQNLGASNVTFVFQVVFGFAPINPVSNFTITATNIGGTNGFLLTWFAPTNDLFQVQWTDNLAPPAWNTFTNIIGYTGPVTPTNGLFSFFDDGSQSGGLGPMRFYRLILLQSTNVLALPFQAGRIIDALTPLVVTNTATDSNTNATLNYTLTSTVPGLPAPGIDANGIITWTPTLAQAGTVNIFTTVVTDNGVPPISATNSFTVTVNPLPVLISSVTVTTNGNFQLQWSAPTNYQFQVAWTTNLMPPMVWNYIPPTPPYITSVTTNFTFVDTNAPTAMKFYRLVEYP